MTVLPESKTLTQLKALASDVRFEMVRILAHGEHCVCDLEAILGLPQSKVSYHLQVLKEAELVSSEQRGKNSYYRLERESLYSLGGELLCELLTPDLALTQRIKSVC
jgi:ArsR family transcriptional regulator, arsenate/arsenite/antimonite-responsive transcriptional repressor